ncbi:hypothetical protein TIFTF001_055534 [Ficus carica]|uniref:Uncharacterized protein n=1 Tax=Ficus carica TaxID=3494 RepID=A0AA88EBR4_FICCA|nr:hypothetical protein TIFTF001_055534 [Ficus carica]
MERSILCPIKYTEHRRVTKKVTKPAKRSSSSENSPAVPRVVRISVTDPNATDSSSDEEDGGESIFSRQRVKRYVNEPATSFLSNQWDKRRAVWAKFTLMAGRCLLMAETIAINSWLAGEEKKEILLPRSTASRGRPQRPLVATGLSRITAWVSQKFKIKARE